MRDYQKKGPGTKVALLCKTHTKDTSTEVMLHPRSLRGLVNATRCLLLPDAPVAQENHLVIDQPWNMLYGRQEPSMHGHHLAVEDGGTT